MNRTIEATLRTGAVLASLALSAGTVLAHGGGHVQTRWNTTLIGAVLFGVGLSVFGVTTAVERVCSADSLYTDVGVTLGLLVVGVGAFVYWI